MEPYQHEPQQVGQWRQPLEEAVGYTIGFMIIWWFLKRAFRKPVRGLIALVCLTLTWFSLQGPSLTAPWYTWVFLITGILMLGSIVSRR